ncbi:MAG TPA: pentapeptide repeat-containing protein [Leptolyngbyaceae cyanobacterium]
MANEQHWHLLKKGVEVWNEWRNQYPEIVPDLSEAQLHQEDLGGVNLIGADLRFCDLSGANLMGANLHSSDLSNANLSEAYLSNANLFEANLCEAILREAYLFEANLGRVNLNGADLQWVYLGQADLSGTYMIEANLYEADLRGAYLIGTNLSDANLQRANLSGADIQAADLRRANLAGANLIGARLIRTNFEQANLTGCAIYGISCWELNLLAANQSNLAIANPTQITDPRAIGTNDISVDNLEIAQFVYLLLNHKKIRQTLDGDSEIVLILGNFNSPERQDILATIRNKLHFRAYLPIVFDLNKPVQSDLTETISCLAKMARFTIVDLTDVKNIGEQLEELFSQLKRVPVQPLLQANAKDIPILKDLQKYPWILETYQYKDLADLSHSLTENLINLAVNKAKELSTYS